MQEAAQKYREGGEPPDLDELERLDPELFGRLQLAILRLIVGSQLDQSEPPAGRRRR